MNLRLYFYMMRVKAFESNGPGAVEVLCGIFQFVDGRNIGASRGRLRKFNRLPTRAITVAK
jgi:hypothetical protein